MAKAKKTKTPPKDLSTEERIKEAARKIFTRKGFAATRTRDIAEESGINLALLNYYFRSKEKLFDIVMMDNLSRVIQGVVGLINDQNSSLDDKVSKIVAFYVNQLESNPDLTLFVITEIRNSPERLTSLGIVDHRTLPDSRLVKQIVEALRQAGNTDLKPLHLVLNILGLTIFPFIARPLFTALSGVSDEAFNSLMDQRKQLIPIWIKHMITQQSIEQ